MGSNWRMKQIFFLLEKLDKWLDNATPYQDIDDDWCYYADQDPHDIHMEVKETMKAIREDN